MLLRLLMALPVLQAEAQAVYMPGLPVVVVPVVAVVPELPVVVVPVVLPRRLYLSWLLPYLQALRGQSWQCATTGCHTCTTGSSCATTAACSTNCCTCYAGPCTTTCRSTCAACYELWRQCRDN